jgi:hypothetical protein
MPITARERWNLGATSDLQAAIENRNDLIACGNGQTAARQKIPLDVNDQQGVVLAHGNGHSSGLPKALPTLGGIRGQVVIGHASRFLQFASGSRSVFGQDQTASA